MRYILGIRVPSIVALATALLIGCQWGRSGSSVNYFPLTPNSTWTYQIISKSQATQFQITDRVVGIRYIPSLKISGSVVDESYSMASGGTRPLVYYPKEGYPARLSALHYDQGKIETPSWGRSEEAQFLPLQLMPNMTWSNFVLPLGHLHGSFDVSQTHSTFHENRRVEVPAGRFNGCIRIETKARYEGGRYAILREHLQLDYIDWYAPQVGLVKTVALEGEPHGVEMERVELVSFRISRPRGIRLRPAATKRGMDRRFPNTTCSRMKCAPKRSYIAHRTRSIYSDSAKAGTGRNSHEEVVRRSVAFGNLVPDNPVLVAGRQI